MNWKIILLLIFAGALIAVGSTYGMIKSGSEYIYWAVLALVSGFVIAKTCSRVFMHGVITGLLSGIVASVIQAVMFNTYLENNASSLDGFKELPIALAPQFVILFSGPFFGIAYGIIVGLIAVIISKMTSKSAA